jgi:hypothetical protein
MRKLQAVFLVALSLLLAGAAVAAPVSTVEADQNIYKDTAPC